MKYLLDTHAIIWYYEQNPRLGRKAYKIISEEKHGTLCISSISFFEIAMLERAGKIGTRIDIARVLKKIESELITLNINSAIAFDAVALNLPHNDPFDRIISATARHHKLKLVTVDAKLQDSGLVETIW